jgi:hypothetical protein
VRSLAEAFMSCPQRDVLSKASVGGLRCYVKKTSGDIPQHPFRIVLILNVFLLESLRMSALLETLRTMHNAIPK